MMTISDKILQAREERYHKLLDLQDTYKTLVSLKVNYPGKNKNDFLAYLLINALNIDQLELSIEEVFFFESLDGPYYIIALNQDGKLVKDKTIYFEENHPLGRFMDLDVYSEKKELSRHNKRKCYLCDQPAHECIRSEKHAYDDLLEYIYGQTIKYYQDLLYDLIDESIMTELDLDPKFGLVTKYTSGSHNDMDYQIMINAKKAIIPFFIDMFKLCVSADNFNAIIIELKKLGLQAEKAMLNATNQVNAYKGLIFHIGLIVSTYAFFISRRQTKTFKEMIKGNAEIFFNIKDDTPETFGKIASKKYHISGAKGEALSAYKHVHQALKIYKTKEDALKTLVYLICHIEDTNLLKRSNSIKKYNSIKNAFCNLNLKDQNKVNKLSDYCIDNLLSFGGSADLLVVTVFIKKLMENHWNISLI